MSREVTEKTFQSDVLDRSEKVPVLVDLWATWCKPCVTLGPILEKVVNGTGGKVELTKVDIDQHPRIADVFRVSSVPAVFALYQGQIVDSFIGAIPEREVQQFVDRVVDLLPKSETEQLVAAGDEKSLRLVLESEPDHPGAIVALATLLTADGETDEALSLLARIPETLETRRAAAAARRAASGTPVDGPGGVSARLDDLLERAKDDAEARQQYIDILETLDPDDARRTRYRRALASRLY
jgi:putative thioredoxin